MSIWQKWADGKFWSSDITWDDGQVTFNVKNFELEVEPLPIPGTKAWYESDYITVYENGYITQQTLYAQTITVGEPSHKDLADDLRQQVPNLMTLVKPPCMCENIGTSVWWLIQHLNDWHHPRYARTGFDTWTRERIADWLDTLDVDLTVHAPQKEEA